MSKNWQDIIEERKRKQSSQKQQNSDPFYGDHRAKSRNIPLSKSVDKSWEQIMVERGVAASSFLDDPKQKKAYDRPYHNFNLDQQQNTMVQDIYDHTRAPFDKRIDTAQAFKPKPKRPIENATLTNIPKNSETAKKLNNVNRGSQLSDTSALFRPAAPEATKPITQPTKKPIPTPNNIRDHLNIGPGKLQKEIDYQIGREYPEFPAKTMEDYPYSLKYGKDSIQQTPEQMSKHLNKTRGFRDKVKSFFSGLAAPFAKPVVRAFDDGMDSQLKDANGMYRYPENERQRTHNFYTQNEDKILQMGYTKEQLNEMRIADLAAAEQMDDAQYFNKWLDRPKDYQPTTGDNLARAAGEITGRVGVALTLGQLGNAAGLTGMQSSALVGGGTGALESYGERHDIEKAAKNIARNTVFYMAGHGVSNKIGEVAGQLMSKYGLETNLAVQYATQAVKGLGFDAGGYAATVPTYPMLGDKMPTGKEIALDMAVGMLFDTIPNMFDTKGIVDANKAIRQTEIEGNQVRMNLALEKLQKAYEQVGQIEKAMPGDVDTLNGVYDGMLRDIELTREVFNSQKIVGQEDTIQRVNWLFNMTEDAITRKKSKLAQQPPKTPEALRGIEETGSGYTKLEEDLSIDQPLRSQEQPPIRPQEQPPLRPQEQPVEIPKQELPQQQLEAPQPKQYGKSGNKAYKKWGTNEYVEADLSNPSDPYTQDYTRFFETWYEAGRLGVPEYMVRYEGTADFPPFLETAFYQSGKNDAAAGSPKKGVELPQPKTQEPINQITKPLVEEVGAPTENKEIEKPKPINKKLYDRIDNDFKHGSRFYNREELDKYIKNHDPSAMDIRNKVGSLILKHRKDILKDSYQFGSGIKAADQRAVDQWFSEHSRELQDTIAKELNVYAGDYTTEVYDVGDEVLYYDRKKKKPVKAKILHLSMSGAMLDVNGHTLNNVDHGDILQTSRNNDLDEILGLKPKSDLEKALETLITPSKPNTPTETKVEPKIEQAKNRSKAELLQENKETMHRLSDMEREASKSGVSMLMYNRANGNGPGYARKGYTREEIEQQTQKANDRINAIKEAIEKHKEAIANTDTTGYEEVDKATMQKGDKVYWLYGDKKETAEIVNASPTNTWIEFTRNGERLEIDEQTKLYKPIDTSAYEKELKRELLGQQKEVYDYLKAMKQGNKAAVYYKSPELSGVDDLNALSTFIRFTDNKQNHKLDVMQMEMSEQIPQVKELENIEDFAQYLVDSVKKYRTDSKELEKTVEEKGQEKATALENELQQVFDNYVKTLEQPMPENILDMIDQLETMQGTEKNKHTRKVINKIKRETQRYQDEAAAKEANKMSYEEANKTMSYDAYKIMYEAHKEDIRNDILTNDRYQSYLDGLVNEEKNYTMAAIKLTGWAIERLEKYADAFKFEGKPDELRINSDIHKAFAEDQQLIRSYMKGEVKNEPTKQVRTDGEGTLEEVSTKDVQGATEAGDTTPTTTTRTGADERGNDPTNRSGDGLRPGVGDSEGEVHTTTTGEQRVEEEIKQKKEKTLETPKGKNYVIEKDLDLAKGPKGKYHDNIAAIKLVKKLEAEQRQATPKEQELLAKYVGWGGIDKVFSSHAEWQIEHKELKELLSEEEYVAARKTVKDAYYTPINVVKAIYQGLEHLGFKGGNVLEPSAGVGNFIGAMPTHIKNTNFSGVEMDTITGKIAKYLYPNANIQVKPYQKANVPDNYYDVAIGNVPYGNFGVVDMKYPDEVTSLIHNYFFAKTVDKVKPGGVIAFLTSKGTLEAKGIKFRKYMEKHADLIGAVRLPNNTFKGNAGTSVVSDLLIFKKREPGTPYAGEKFLQHGEVEVKRDRSAYTTREDINEYYINHPEMILGEMVYKLGQNGYDIDVEPVEGADLGKQITEALSKINVKMEYKQTKVETINQANREAIAAPPGKHKENAYVIGEDNTLYINRGDKLIPYQAKNNKEVERIIGMIGIRDAARKVVRTQLDNASEADKNAARKQLNKVYDAFVSKHKAINDPTNKRAYIDDPDFAFLSSLEDYDKETKTAQKADIFTKDTISPVKVIDKVDNAKDALVVSLNETGHIDLERMGAISGKTKAEVIKELEKESLIFKQTDGSYEIAERYLSGNVRVKLEQAKALAEVDPTYQKNVEALKAVQPKDLTATEIKPQIGQVWIPIEYYKQFLGHLFDARAEDFSISYHPTRGNYELNYTGYGNVRQSAEATSKWGTERKNGWDIIQAAFNSKDVKCTTKIDDKVVVLVEETAIAKQKLQEVKDEFAQWIFKDADREMKLVELYNYTQNNIALPKYDGSHLEVKGMNPLKQLRPHQADAVWRVISSGGNTLLAHKVGAGKSGEMAAAAMALRQMGIVKKPMFVVPNHLVEQWGSEFLSFFPSAKILVAGKKDFEKQNRKILMNKIATGDWDAVIVGESSFSKISLNEETLKEFFEKQINELREAKEMAALEKDKSVNIKNLETAIANLEVKMEKKIAKLAADQDNTPFEELGVDSLFVDEAHRFKNLMYATNMVNVSGLGSKDGADKAFDLYMKVRLLQRMNGGKGIVFATATPVMNSMSEMYIMQRYLQGDLLEQRGLTNFDAWAKQFGEVITVMEMTPEGKGYREKQSFSKFKNVGELMQMFKSFADVLTHIEGLKIPKLKGGKPNIVVCTPSEAQIQYIENLANRAEAVRNRKVDPTEDNMLKITGDGKKLALDQRLVDDTLPEDPASKVNVSVNNVFDIWQRTKSQKSAQLIFCDLSTPKGKKDTKGEDDDKEEAEDNDNVSIYHEIREKLALKGIPKKEIAFIHEANTDAKKLTLFTKVNKGEIRVLIGSTEKMGVGMNAQKKLIALHHLDAPWRPGDVEQRDGRILRQGNENPEVEIYHYVTEKTFDARMWDILLRKQSFIDTVMNGTTDMREMEDISDTALNYSEIKAVASGNPLILEQNEVANKLRTLAMAKKGYETNIHELKKTISWEQNSISIYKEEITGYKADIAQREDINGDNFKIKIGKTTYDNRKEAGEKLIDLFRTKAPKVETVIGKFAGFDLAMTPLGQLVIKGANDYKVTMSDDAAGTVTKLINAVNKFEKSMEVAKELIEEKTREVKKLQVEVKKPFPKLNEYKELETRYEAIMRELTAEAAPQQPGATEEVTEEEDNDEVNAFTSVKGQPHTDLGEASGLNTDVKNTLSASEIFAKFEKAFDVAIKKRPRRGTLGTYNNREHLIRVKKANDIPVLTHEVGHLLDKVYGFSESHKAPYAKELEMLGENTSTKSYSPKKKRREGVAEFVRLFMTNHEEALKLDFYTHFEKALTDKELATVKELQQDIWKLQNLSAEERVGKTIVSYDKKKKQQGIDLDKIVRQFQAQILNENYPIEWAAKEMGGKEAEEAMKHRLGAFRGYEGIALFNIDANGDGYYQTDLKGNNVGKSYSAILKPVHKDKKIRDDFNKYQVARRAMDYFDKKLEMPETKEVYERTIAAMETKYPQFKDVFAELIKFRHNNLHLLVEAGLMTEKQFAKTVKENSNYTPLNRDVDHYKYATGDSKKIGGKKNIVKRLKGGGQDIIDPEINDIQNTFAYRSAAMRNEILIKLAAMAETNEDVGHIMSNTHLNMQMFELTQQQLNHVVEQGLENLVKLGVIDENTLPTDFDYDVMNKVFKPNYAAGPNQVIVYGVKEAGKPRLYDVHPEFYEALTGMTNYQTNILVDFLGKVSHFSKTGIIFTPQYVYRNASRDTLQNLIGSEAGINAIDIVGGFISAVTKDEHYKMYQKHGGAINFISASDRKFVDETIDDIFRSMKMLDKVKHKFRHPLRTIADIIEPLENAGRIAEMKKYLKKHGNSEKAIQAAIYAGRDLSVDFKQTGALIKKLQLNRLINFFNTQIQGTRKDVRLLTNKRTSLRTIIRSLMYMTIPTLALWWLNRENENYKDISPFYRDFFFNIPVGDHKTTELFIHIPKPYGILSVLFSALPERLAEKYYSDNPAAFNGFGDTIDQSLGVPLVPSALNPIYEVEKNEDYRNIPIVNTYEQGLPPELQQNERTSEVSKKISEITKDIPGLPEMFKSPKQLDHLIKGYTGTLGRIALNASSEAVKGGSPGEVIKEGLSTGFMSNSTDYPNSTNTFYNYKKSLDDDYMRWRVTGVIPENFNPHVRELYKRIYIEIDNINENQALIESEPQTATTEKQLEVLREMELKLMRGANAIYEQEVLRKK